MKFYRYDWREYASIDYDDGYSYHNPLPDPKIELSTLALVKETKKGYWITYDSFGSGWKKWIPKESKKRFAYPTKEEALNSFIKRTEKRLQINQHEVECCRVALLRAKDIKYELDNEKTKN